MGIAAGDYENNGHLWMVNTDFADDYNVLFQNDGTGYFTDVSWSAGIAESSIPFVGFADGFLKLTTRRRPMSSSAGPKFRCIWTLPSSRGALGKRPRAAFCFARPAPAAFC